MSTPGVIGILVTFAVIALTALILGIIAITDNNKGATGPQGSPGADATGTNSTNNYMCLTMSAAQNDVKTGDDIKFDTVAESNGSTITFAGPNSMSLVPGTYLMYVSLGYAAGPVTDFTSVFNIVDSDNTFLFLRPVITFNERTLTVNSDLPTINRIFTVTTAKTIKVRATAIPIALTSSVVEQLLSVFHVIQLK